MHPHFPFQNTYARLPDRFFARVRPTPVQAPALIRVNAKLAEHLGLDPDYLASPEGVAVLAGNEVPEGAESIATAYAGHQFGGFVPQLGDGRAILLGEVVDRGGVRRDVQLKGPGRTPFSRGGDGRAALGPVLREYLVSEAMAALGIPTTRALAAVTTGETVRRETMLPGAVLTRVASSHLRVGTFQYFAARRDTEAIRLLADYVIERHYPSVRGAEQPYRALLHEIVQAQARLIPRWLHVGFIHGVMNTDNMSLAGETIDFGPCAFLDEYSADTVFSSIDSYGRYAFGNQPAIAQWNLTRLAECLVPLLAEETDAAIKVAEGVLTGFAPAFEQHYTAGLRRKLGLTTEQENDGDLAEALLDAMTEAKADFTLTFRGLSQALPGAGGEAAFSALFPAEKAPLEWLRRWHARHGQEPAVAPETRRAAMDSVNPAFIPRNHRIEEAIQAGLRNDFGPFETLHAVLSTPFSDQPERAEYARPPREHERVLETFCGT